MKSSTSFTCNDCCFGYCSPFDFQDSARSQKRRNWLLNAPAKNMWLVGYLPFGMTHVPVVFNMTHCPTSHCQRLKYHVYAVIQLLRYSRGIFLELDSFRLFQIPSILPFRKTSLQFTQESVVQPTTSSLRPASTRLLLIGPNSLEKKTTQRNLVSEHSPNWDHTKNIAKGKFIGWKK